MNNKPISIDVYCDGSLIFSTEHPEEIIIQEGDIIKIVVDTVLSSLPKNTWRHIAVGYTAYKWN